MQDYIGSDLFFNKKGGKINLGIFKCWPDQYVLHITETEAEILKKKKKKKYMSDKNRIVVCLLEELDILVAQIAAALQCTYLPITALSVPNTFITAN